MRPRFLAALVFAALAPLGMRGAAADNSFPPLDSWKAAVAAGDESSLLRLYSTQPPARVYYAKNPLPSLQDEAHYWTGLKSSGITQVNPKILSIIPGPGQEQLVLRINALAGGQPLVASMQQIWVRQPAGWRLALSNRSDFGADAGRRLPEPAKPNPSLYPAPAAAQSELKEALARAGAEHKRVLVVFGANWCYDCHVLDTTFHSKDFAPLVNRNYVVLHISIGDEGKDNNDIAARMGVNLDRGVPSLAVLDPSGRVLIAQQNGEFESTVRIGPGDVRSFLERWAPPHKAG